MDERPLTDEELDALLLELIPLHIHGTGTVTYPDGTIPQEEN